MYDLMHTKYSNTIERPLVPGVEIGLEGLVLKSVMVGSSEHFRTTEGTTGEKIVGFSHNRSTSMTTEIVIEDTLSIPATPGPYTVQLKYPNLVAGTVRVYDVTDAADMVPGAVSDGRFTVNITTGLLTFAVADASHPIIVTYRRNLTAIEAQTKYRQAAINGPSPSYFGNAIALSGNGEIFTDAYDTSVSYEGVSDVYAGAGGYATSASSGNTLIPGSRITQLPTASSPLLGFAFNLA
jgi:hypothetical protein